MADSVGWQRFSFGRASASTLNLFLAIVSLLNWGRFNILRRTRPLAHLECLGLLQDRVLRHSHLFVDRVDY